MNKITFIIFYTLTLTVNLSFLKRFRDRSVNVPWPYRHRSVGLPWPFRDRTVTVPSGYRDRSIHKKILPFRDRSLPFLTVLYRSLPFLTVPYRSLPFLTVPHRCHVLSRRDKISYAKKCLWCLCNPTVTGRLRDG